MRDPGKSMEKVQCERKTVKDAQLLRLNDLPVSPNCVSALDVRRTVDRSRATAQHHFNLLFRFDVSTQRSCGLQRDQDL